MFIGPTMFGQDLYIVILKANTQIPIRIGSVDYDIVYLLKGKTSKKLKKLLMETYENIKVFA